MRLPSGLIRQYSCAATPPTRTTRSPCSAKARAAADPPNSTTPRSSAQPSPCAAPATTSHSGPPPAMSSSPRHRHHPVLAMARHATRHGVPWSLHYGGRRPDTMAFARELRDLAHQAGASSPCAATARKALPLHDIVREAPRTACSTPAALGHAHRPARRGRVRPRRSHPDHRAVHRRSAPAPAPDDEDTTPPPRSRSNSPAPARP
ncbi:hypothetical protein ACFQV4_23250 [Streptomyces thermocarboxydus]